MGPVTKDCFLKFMMSPGWTPFMENYQNDFDNLAWSFHRSNEQVKK